VYFVPMMCTSVGPFPATIGAEDVEGTGATGVVLAAVTVDDVAVATATVDVDTVVDIVDVAASDDDVAAACAAAKGTLRMPTRASAIAMTMLIPANAMAFVFILSQ
jgi:hypothetical protein